MCLLTMWSLVGLLVGVFVVGISADPAVRTPLGLVSGYYNSTLNGRRYRAFEGIPYAKPPVGELRFEPPQRFGSWNGTLLATTRGSPCVQYMHGNDHLIERVLGNEDCLFLNIYTNAPENSTKLLPVVFFIHGGAFQFGTGSDQRPNVLLDRDIVMATVSYRLGPFGFLSTGDEIVPGNMGLKDQSMALRWVSENIKYFGGDPKKITITGLSAGGASVHYHYLSPLSRGLFHAGISFSGTALDCWTQTEASVEKAKKLADTLGCPTGNSKDLVKCLKTKPAKSLGQLVGNFMGWLFNPFTPFGPVTEVTTNHTFIDRLPVDIITSGDAADVPWLTAVTSEEGLYPAAEFVANEELLEQLNTNWELIAPHLLDYNYTLPKSQHASAADAIRKHYLGNSKIDKSTVNSLIHMIGDRLYAADGEKAARLMARANKSPVWFYFYNYRSQFSVSDFFTPAKEDFGVSHGDDVSLVIYPEFLPRVTNNRTLKVQNTLLNIWSSFAANGSPDIGVNWTRVDPDSAYLKLLVISGPQTPRMEVNSNFAQKTLWQSIGFNENIIHNSPSSANSVIYCIHCIFMCSLFILIWI